MEISDKTNFALRVILFLLSLYFLFNITDENKEVETRFGVGIIIAFTIILGIVFVTCLCKN